MFLGRDGFIWWIGVVEDNQDPLVLGRARVRIFGYHAPSNVSTATNPPGAYVPGTPGGFSSIFTGGIYGGFSIGNFTQGTPGGANQNISIGNDTGEMPTKELPWAVTMMPANMPGAYGIPNLGDWVLGFFLDGEEAQEPCILGYLPGIPPETLPTDVKERFSEQISTTRSFNTVANVLPNSFGVTGNEQRNRFRFEQPSGNVFEMVNDTSKGNPITLKHSSLPNLQLKYKTAILGLNESEGENKNIEIADTYTKIRHYNGVYGRSSVMPASTENSFRSRSILPTKQFSIGHPLAGNASIGKDVIYTVEPQEEVAGYKYYHPARQDVSPTWDEQDLVRNVGLLMNTVFPPEPIISQTIAALPPAPRGGGGGGGCFLGETLVTMSDWTKKRIDQIKDGDYVFNKDRTQVNKVLFIERVPDKYMWKELYTPSGDYEPFATPNHPLFVDGEWVSIDNEVYPWLGKINSVKNPITCETQGELVYNLWVTGDGTYIVNGFGTTSIMMDGGIMRVCYQNEYLSQDDIMELMREFTTQGNMMTYGSYLFNKLFGYITYKPIVKVLANTIKREHDFLPRKAMVFLMKVFGKTATLYNKLKG
jgi:hypothetical protein